MGTCTFIALRSASSFFAINMIEFDIYIVKNRVYNVHSEFFLTKRRYDYEKKNNIFDLSPFNDPDLRSLSCRLR